jgi:hypothetical protein
MRSKRDPEDSATSEGHDVGPSYYERAIRTSIGRGLRSYYDLSEPIPERMRRLLAQLDEPPAPQSQTVGSEEQKPTSGSASK